MGDGLISKIKDWVTSPEEEMKMITWKMKLMN